MARRGRPWPAAIVAVLVVAGALVVSGFSAQGQSASGGVRPRPAAGAGTSAATTGWGKAITLPAAAGTPYVISCSSPGNCGTAGPYRGGYVYVANQVRGAWGQPKVIPGTARTANPSSQAGGIACFSAGGCLVVGSYTDGAGHTQAFIAAQVRGRWGKVFWVPGLARLNRGNSASLGNLSCRSAGNCTAVGSYTDAKGRGHLFVVSEVRGVWGEAMPAPGSVTGLPGQRPGTVAEPGLVSCASPGNCAAAGTYPVGVAGTLSDGNQAYVDNEVHGVWGRPIAVPGLAALNTGPADGFDVLSCPSPGTCAGAGSYIGPPHGASDVFVVDETGGTWGTAVQMPGTAALFTNGYAQILTIACPAAGDCVMGGAYNIEIQGGTFSQAFVVSQAHGVWGKAIQVPGTARLDAGGDSWLLSVSCSSPGNCGGAGNYSAAYDGGINYTQPFVINQVHGAWANAIEVPGIKTLPLTDGQAAATTAISCTAPDRCSASGYYQDAKGGFHTFVDSQR